MKKRGASLRGSPLGSSTVLTKGWKHKGVFSPSHGKMLWTAESGHLLSLQLLLQSRVHFSSGYPTPAAVPAGAELPCCGLMQREGLSPGAAGCRGHPHPAQGPGAGGVTPLRLLQQKPCLWQQHHPASSALWSSSSGGTGSRIRVIPCDTESSHPCCCCGGRHGWSWYPAWQHHVPRELSGGLRPPQHCRNPLGLSGLSAAAPCQGEGTRVPLHPCPARPREGLDLASLPALSHSS